MNTEDEQLPAAGDPQDLTVNPARLHGPETALDDALESRLQAIAQAARYHGVELERSDLRLVPGSGQPSPAELVGWLTHAGLWAKADRLKWASLMRLHSEAPVVLLFNDGSAGVLVGKNITRNVLMLRDPRAPMTDLPVPVDQLRLSQIWSGETILVRQDRTARMDDAEFNFGWIFRLVMTERSIIREISVASLTLSFLTIVPALIVMQVLDKVVAHHSMTTLVLIAWSLGLIYLFESLLSFSRENLTASLAARLDTKLNLHVFNRLLALPLDYFEMNTAGQTAYRVQQVSRVRQFITGSMLETILDLMTLLVLVPLLFYLQPDLTWIIIGCAILIALIIFAYLKPMRRMFGLVVAAEIEKNTIMIETTHGIRTVKSLAIEPQQKDNWDHKVANAANLRLEAAHLANWPKTLVIPLQRMAERGTLLVGGYLAVIGSPGVSVGSLVAILILGARVAGPLVGIARLMQEMEEIRASVMQIGKVLNNPVEVTSTASGIRNKIMGGLSFDDLTFTYAGSKIPALKKLTFEVPAGTMLGLVGRSGSGKSTVTRMLQGISRNYEGYLKIDGTELREIQLSHLRKSFGVVLQDNFLFRGTVRDNIIAGRPGLTLEDAVRAARLAGAEEFIERMPAGYESVIEEGSPNLSGGQKQRLAIARAVITDPRLMILDEATSALDPESEALVNANLKRIARGRTMVIVSHRLSSLLDCDLIMVLERGSMVDMAPHAVLLERCSIYRTLWFQQNRHLNPGAAGGAPALAQGD